MVSSHIDRLLYYYHVCFVLNILKNLQGREVVLENKGQIIEDRKVMMTFYKGKDVNVYKGLKSLYHASSLSASIIK